MTNTAPRYKDIHVPITKISCLVFLTLSGRDGEAVSTGHFGHHLPSKRSHQDLDTLVFLEVLHTQLSILVATKSDQAPSF